MDMENNPLISQDENGKPIFCLPNNRWVHYHELEHEKWHRNSFKALLLDHYELDIDKEISTIVDFGYGDILCNLNYFVWLNEITPIRLKIIIDPSHREKSFKNKESTTDKIDYILTKEWKSNLEYTYLEAPRPMCNLLRYFKSAFKGMKLLSHCDQRTRRMFYKYVKTNPTQYVYIPLSQQIKWFPAKTQWKGEKSKTVCVYRYSPPITYDLIEANSFQQIGDKMISESEDERDNWWKELEKEIKAAGWTIKWLDYDMTPKQLLTQLSKCKYLVSSRGGFAYLAQLTGTPTVIIYPSDKYAPQVVQFHKNRALLFNQNEIANATTFNNTLTDIKIMWNGWPKYNSLSRQQSLQKQVNAFKERLEIRYQKIEDRGGK